MLKILLIATAALAVLAAIAFLLRLRRPSSDKWPFYAKKPLSRPEQVLYYRLAKALPDHIVLAQVQLSRVLGVVKGANFGTWNNRINRLSLDFLICGKDASVVAAIELDDSSHARYARREADERKENALRAAGVPLLRWSVSALPDEAAIRNAIAKHLRFERL
jgi:very-short-patch-repair endonuclease